MPTFPPLHSSLVGFGELSITASQVVKTPLTGSQSAGVWGVAATDTEMTALKSAGPKQTAGVVAYGGSTSAAIAAEISPNNTTGQVVSVLAQGQQTGLKAQSDSGPAVYGVSGTGMAIYGTSTGGWAGYFVGKVSCSSDLVVNGALTADGRGCGLWRKYFGGDCCGDFSRQYDRPSCLPGGAREADWVEGAVRFGFGSYGNSDFWRQCDPRSRPCKWRVCWLLRWVGVLRG